jgi:hypothetical protein
VDRQRFDADQDPTFLFDADLDFYSHQCQFTLLIFLLSVINTVGVIILSMLDRTYYDEIIWKKLKNV